jgi:DNA-directed RNA polymerase specialized sigma24 family protein
MRAHKSFSCNFTKACHVLWAVHVQGLSQTATAILLELNVGTVNHIVHRRRFQGAYPVPMT